VKLNSNAVQSIVHVAGFVRATAQNEDQAVPSPCVGVCEMDSRSSLCRGCLRTLQEIQRWSGCDAAEKRAVWRDIEVRLAQYQS